MAKGFAIITHTLKSEQFFISLYTYTCTHTRTHARTHARTHTHAHTHTHTQVNEQDMTNATHAEAVAALKNVTDICLIVVSREVLVVMPDDDGESEDWGLGEMI